MSVKFASILILLPAMLAACHSGPHKVKEPLPPPQDVTPGSTFSVVKGFLIPADSSTVFFQDQHLYPLGEIRPDFPYCVFDAGTATADGQLIRNMTFTVRDVEYDERAVGSGGTDVSVTRIHLLEPVSGDSYRLDCALPLLSGGADFVTPAEVQGAVGGYLELKAVQ